KTALTVRLTPAQRQTLLAWQRATTISAGRGPRGRTLLLPAGRGPPPHRTAPDGPRRRFGSHMVPCLVGKGTGGCADTPDRGSRSVPCPAVLADAPRLSA